MTRHLPIISILCLCLALPALGQLPPYEDWHPRLLVDDDLVSALPDSIAADPLKVEVWDDIVSASALYAMLPPETSLGTNYGLTILQMLSLVSLVEPDPLATDCRDKVKECVDYLIANDTVWGTGDDLSTILRLRTFLIAYDMVYQGASEAERQIVLDEIREYMEVVTTDWVWRRNIYNPFCSNHGIATGSVLGLANLGLEGEWPGDPLLDTARSMGDSLIDKALGDLLGEDGSFSEGGLYLSYSYRHLIAYWEAALRLEEQTLWDADKVEASLYWVAYQLFAKGDGYFLNRNDCSEQSRPLSLHTTFWSWTTRRLADPRFARWVHDHVSGPDGFNYGINSDLSSVIFFHNPGEILSPQAFLPDHRYFPDQGLYAYRKGWPGDLLHDSFQFTFQAGTFYGGHWQEDVGQLTLHAFTHRFAMDHGPGSPAVETEAHNLPLVDNIGQHNTGEGIGTDGQMFDLLTEGFCHVLKADIEPAYTSHSPFNDPDWPVEGSDWSWGYDGGNPMERADRWLLLLQGQDGIAPAIYILDDFRKDSQIHDYEWRLHFDQSLDLNVTDDHYEMSGIWGRMDARLLTPPADETSWETENFDNGGPDVESKALSVHHDAVDARFLWQWLTFQPDEVEPPITVQRFDRGLHATVGEEPGRVRDFFYCWDPILLESDIVLSGLMGVIESGVGELRSALVEGTEFSYEGRLYFGMEPAGTASVTGDTVQISNPFFDFEIYAPDAVAVMSRGEPVPFEVNGDYVFRGDWTGAPADPGTGAAGSGIWRLRAHRGLALDEAFRLKLAGPGSVEVRLDIYDVRGRRVARLYRGALPAGDSELLWAGKNDAGRGLPAGLYLARLAADGQVASAKLLLLH